MPTSPDPVTRASAPRAGTEHPTLHPATERPTARATTHPTSQAPNQAPSRARSRAHRATALTARVLLVPFAVFLFLVTWLPGDDAEKVTGIVATLAHLLESWSIPFSVGYPILEFLANVALFAPLGLLLHLSWPALPWWAVTAIGCSTSTLIELVQIALPTRYPTLSDIIANTLGTAAGFLVAYVIRRVVMARAAA